MGMWGGSRLFATMGNSASLNELRDYQSQTGGLFVKYGVTMMTMADLGFT